MAEALSTRSLTRWRRRGSLSLALSLIAFGTAILVLRTREPPPAEQITLTAGPAGTTRDVVAHALADEVSARGVTTRVVASGSTLSKLRLVDSGAVDFALVSGALRTDRYTHVREVSPLYVETLHLLVKQELAGAVEKSLLALKGHTVNLGPPGSSTEGLATAVLSLSGMGPASHSPIRGTAVIDRHTDPSEIDGRLAGSTGGGRDALPDAVFDLATIPSKIAEKYVRLAQYRLVSIPFADAFRLSAIVAEGAKQVSEEEVERLFTQDALIPPFTYQIEPPVPAVPIHTLGAPLLLVANDQVSSETVERVLEAVFESRFARMHQPPLERGALNLPSRITVHPGTIAYRQRDRRLVTADDIEALSDGLSVVGALIGASLFLWQAWRQRRQARREELFGSYMLRVAEIERQIVELELASDIALEPLISKQRELLQLKSETLDHFTAGALDGQTALFDLLIPINTARDHIGKLLLHVREKLEDQAEAEGRTPEDLWEEASEATDQAAVSSETAVARQPPKRP